MLQWPDTPNDSPLGDGRHALSTERPATVDDLVALVGRLSAEGVGIYPQGGRTSLESGGIPSRPGVAIDTRGLDRVIDYPAADMTITIEAGMTLARLQALLAEQGQRLNLEAPRDKAATLGGIYATNTSGPRRFGMGRPRDLIIGVGFAASTGDLIHGGGRVVKNVAGYDFPRLLTGSFGSLGILAQLTLKVRPRPEASALAAFGLPGARLVGETLDRLNTSDTRPVAIELLNRPAARAVGLPDVAPWTLVLGFEGTRIAVDWQVGAIRREFTVPPSLIVLDAEAEPLWKSLVESQHPGTGSWSFRANLPASAVSEFAEGWDSAAWRIQAQAGSGIVWGHAETTADPAAIEPSLRSMRRKAVDRGGNLALPRCPTASKASMGVWGEPRADWLLGERVKRALDPAGVMNPGRFVGTI